VARAPVTAEDLAALETDVLAGFVLARAAAGLSEGTITSPQPRTRRHRHPACRRPAIPAPLTSHPRHNAQRAPPATTSGAR
jgi:hypothetical protein